jgi:hypothetical protein
MAHVYFKEPYSTVTVGKLIEHLKQFDPSKQVTIEAFESGEYEVKAIYDYSHAPDTNGDNKRIVISCDF